MSYSLRHIQQGFSRHADEYDRHAELQHSVLYNALKQLRPYFRHYMRLLDAGCGTGFLLELLENSDTNFNMFGCDIAEGMCQRAKSRPAENHPHYIACADVEALPFPDACMDMAISSLTMQWVNHSKKALSELHRVLIPDGRCLITTFGPMTLQELRHSFSGVDTLPHVSEFAPIESMQKWAEEVGFVVENASAEFRCHYYKDVKELMNSMRVIGATNKLGERRKTLTGKNRFRIMEQVYREHYESDRGIPASWEVLYLLLRKA